MKKIIKISLYSLTALVVLVLLLAAFTQTGLFRDRLRSATISALDSLLDAEVQLGSLDGNLVSGFTIDFLSVEVRGGPFLVSERLDLRYNIFDILRRKVSIDRMTLIRPSIALTCSRDGLWNFQRMIRARPSDTLDVRGEQFDWPVLLKRLEIQDGTIVLVDSATLASPDHTEPDPYFVEYHDVTLKELNLVCSASITKNEKRVNVSSLSFVSRTPDIQLHEFSGDFLVTRTESRVDDLVVKTGRSDVRIDARMKDFDLLGGIDLERMKNVPTDLSVRARGIDLGELKRFIRPIDFLGGNVGIELEAGGEFGELDVRRLSVKTGSTDLFVRGAVYNLHAPGELFLDLKFSESELYGPDAQTILPAFDLPGFNALGVTSLDLQFVGRPLDFRTKLQLRTTAGEVRSDLALRIGGPATLAYEGEVVTRDINLAKVFDAPDLVSRLNGIVSVRGSGTDIAGDLTATVTAIVDSSEFLNQRVARSELALDAKKGKLSGRIQAALGTMQSVITAELDKGKGTVPSFMVDGHVSSLNLGDILRDQKYGSDLTMTVRAEGKGLTWEDLNGDFVVDVSPSRYGDYRLTSGILHIMLDQQDPLHKQLKLESNIADFSLTGAFDIGYMAQLASFEMHNLQVALKEKFRALDSAVASSIDYRKIEAEGAELAGVRVDLNARYELRLKDLEPISIVTGNRIFNGKGVVTGSMRGGYNALSLDGEVGLEDFFYGNVDAGVLVQNGRATFAVQDLKPSNPLREAGVRFVAEAEKVHINRDKLDSLNFVFTYRQEYSTYQMKATYNKDIALVVNGLASVWEDQVIFTLNDMQFAFEDLSWQTEGGATIRFDRSGVRMNDFFLRRGSETVAIAGYVGANGDIDATVRGTHLDLNGLRFLLSKDELDVHGRAFAGVGDIEVRARGTLENPTYVVSLQADEVSFRSALLGDVRGDLHYAQRRLDVRVNSWRHYADSVGRPELTITGTLPVDLAMVNITDRIPDAPMSLHIQSDGIHMGVLDPLVPTFNQLSGTMRCNLTVTGTFRDPEYQGELRIDSCQFLFVPNNIVYTFDGEFQPQGRRIKVIQASVANLATDDQFGRKGVVRITGDFSLREFKPADFDLNATGQLLVVKETTGKSSLSVYGNLFVEIGSSGLHYTGTIEQSLLRGDLLIRNSSLVFPPAEAGAAKEVQHTLPLLVVDDTSRTSEVESRSTAAAQYFSPDVAAVSNAGQAATEPTPGKSFLDGLRYDLHVETSGRNTEIRLIFNQVSGEELAAFIEGDFSITGEGKTWVGTLAVYRAYYRFYERFDAEGTISYSGDFMNPELDIRAKYQGTRVLADTVSESKTENIVVNLHITGTRNEPKLDVSMTIDGVDYFSYNGPKSADVQSDALQFIITGSFPLTSAQKNDVAANIGTNVGSSLLAGATSLFSGTLSNFLRNETKFIHQVDLIYGSAGRFDEAAEIRISGVVFNGLWRYGGRVLSDPIGTANVSLQYSFGDIFNSASMRNFMLELERRVQIGAIGRSTDRQEIHSARFFYKLSF